MSKQPTYTSITPGSQHTCREDNVNTLPPTSTSSQPRACGTRMCVWDTPSCAALLAVWLLVVHIEDCVRSVIPSICLAVLLMMCVTDPHSPRPGM